MTNAEFFLKVMKRDPTPMERRLCEAFEVALKSLECRCSCDETGRTILCNACKARQKIEDILK